MAERESTGASVGVGLDVCFRGEIWFQFWCGIEDLEVESWTGIFDLVLFFWYGGGEDGLALVVVCRDVVGHDVSG